MIIIANRIEFIINLIQLGCIPNTIPFNYSIQQPYSLYSYLKYWVHCFLYTYNKLDWRMQLKSVQQSKKMYFIGKQIKSTNNFEQIMMGLYSCREFISELSSLELFNTIVMSLLDLFTNTNSTYIKAQVATILSDCGRTGNFCMYDLPSRPEIANSLVQNLKSNNVLTRILVLQIISAIPYVYSRDTSLYHNLFSRLRGIQQRSKFEKQHLLKQSLTIVSCLRQILQFSYYLAAIFGQNVKEIVQLGGVPIKIVIYLAYYANFQGTAFDSVLRCLWNLVQLQHKSDKKMSKVIQFWFGQFLVKSCSHNYLCVQYYFRYLKPAYPQLQQTISKIQKSNFSFFPFVQSGSENIDFYRSVSQMKHEELLDFCFENYSVQGIIKQDLNKIVLNKILEDMKQEKITVYTILLTFYLSASMRQNYRLDELFATNLDKLIPFKYETDYNNYNRWLLKLLKISLVTSNFNFGQTIISKLMSISLGNQLKYSAIVLFSSYIQLHLSPHVTRFCGFLVVLANLAKGSAKQSQDFKHPKLMALGRLWGTAYQRQIQANYQQIKNIIEYQTSNNLIFNTQTQFRDRKESDLRNEKIKCEQQINSMRVNKLMFSPIAIRAKPYNKIYFSKKTISDIFKNL